MACHCTHCAGTGIIREATDRGTICHELCRYCGGSGGWDEIETTSGSPLARALMKSAADRQERMGK